MNRTAVAFAAIALAAVAGGCVPIEPKAECVAADQCDAALDEPFGDFDDADQTFGKNGTCWANEETAKACVVECDKFVAEQLAAGQAARNNFLIEACGG